MMRSGLTVGPKLAGYVVFIVLVAVISILVVQGGISGAADYIGESLSTAAERPVELLSNFLAGIGGGGTLSASFTYSPSEPDAGETVSFDASGSSPSTAIDSYEWDWTGDGTYDETGETATHTFSSDGTYSVTLRITSSTGQTAITINQVEVRTVD